jgi:hypothetical protein
MKLTPYALLACLGVVAACSSDITADGTGTPQAIVTSRSITSATKGTQLQFTAFAVDQNNQRMAGALTATSQGPAATLDSVVYVPELLETRIYVKPVTATATGVIVTVSGHGLTKDVKVIIS